MHGDATRGGELHVEDDGDGTCRVHLLTAGEAPYAIARKMTRGQASRLTQRIQAEARESGKPIREVVRDAPFMAATVLMVKRLGV